MTLAERLGKYKKENNLDNITISTITGVDKSTISVILHNKRYSPFAAEKIYKALGEDYKEYIIYKTCPHCGKQFIGRSTRDAHCGLRECSLAHKRDINKDYQRRLRAGEVKPKHSEAKRKRLIIPDAIHDKEIIGFAEFMNGRSYGDAQREMLLMKQKEQRMRV